MDKYFHKIGPGQNALWNNKESNRVITHRRKILDTVRRKPQTMVIYIFLMGFSWSVGSIVLALRSFHTGPIIGNLFGNPVKLGNLLQVFGIFENFRNFRSFFEFFFFYFTASLFISHALTGRAYFRAEPTKWGHQLREPSAQ